MKNIFLIINAFFYLNFFCNKKRSFSLEQEKSFLNLKKYSSCSNLCNFKKNKTKEPFINKILIFWHQNDPDKNKKILIKIKNSSILKFNENSIISKIFDVFCYEEDFYEIIKDDRAIIFGFNGNFSFKNLKRLIEFLNKNDIEDDFFLKKIIIKNFLNKKILEIKVKNESLAILNLKNVFNPYTIFDEKICKIEINKEENNLIFNFKVEFLSPHIELLKKIFSESLIKKIF